MRQEEENNSYLKRKVSDFCLSLHWTHVYLVLIKGQLLLIRKYFCSTKRVKAICVCDIIEKRLLDALNLTLRNFANSKSCQRLCNGRCSRDVFIHIPY